MLRCDRGDAVTTSARFFIAYTGENGCELWKSNGTAAGTVLVKDMVPGNPGSDARDLTAVGKTLFFVNDDGVHGRQLWKSDGTAAGTGIVKLFDTPGGAYFPPGIGREPALLQC